MLSKPDQPNCFQDLFSISFLSIYLYIFMEWLFTVTRPSFMTPMTLSSKVAILLLSGLILFVVSLPFLLVLFGLSRVPIFAGLQRLFCLAGSLLPAVFLASLALLMLDNFTYTVFKFGIVSTTGLWRGLYGVAFGLFILAFWRWVFQLVTKNAGNHAAAPSRKARLITGLALLVISIPWGGSLFFNKVNALSQPTTTRSNLPDILLIGSDGLNASHMSLYGYQRDTTPFLKEIAPASLLSENNFPNANITSGSLMSIFTGKLPTQTRMLYPPDILTGIDAYQHFPGILRSNGYYTAEISLDYYGDPDALNLQGGFDLVNGHSATIGKLYDITRRYLPEDVAYFLSSSGKRLYERVEHIYYIRTMRNPVKEATEKLNTFGDGDRVRMTLSLFRGIKQPLFIHVHMMGTHSGGYNPRNYVFSSGQEITANRELDSYDDAILDFDLYVRQLTTGLQEMGRLDNTLIIFYTDHGKDDTSNVRVPLMFRFPKGEYAGKLTHNTQNLDIAPTVLDYIGITPPEWMTGQSLLKGEPALDRPIFSAAPSFRIDKENRLQLDTSKIKPPFYQFGVIGMIICQKWYALDTRLPSWQEAVIQDYPSPCAPGDLPDQAQAKSVMLKRLQADGFEVNALPLP